MIFRLKTPEILDSKVPIPSSKSVSNRVLILNALCDRQKKIDNISPSDDTEVMIKALESNKSDVNIKAAGTAMRFLTAYFAVKKGKWNITGTERMKNRPVKILIDALRSLGAQIECTEREGFPPLHIEGRQLKGGDVYLDGSVSSQYISALLMVAPVMTNGLRLHLTGDAVSKPYINLTVQLMRKFGVIVFVEDRTFTVPPQQYVPASNFTVESDWSAASYWYEMMALSKNNASAVSLAGLTPDSLQGDAALVGLFDRLGVKTSFTPAGVELTKKEIAVDGLFAFDFIDMPDMAQTLAVTSAMLGIPFRFKGLQSLKIKETDRLAALRTEMRKLGYPLVVSNDNAIEWTGERCEAEPFPVIATYEDHRMAMAFAPAAMRLDDGIGINEPEVVSKSYPAFWDDLETAGFSITKQL